MIENIMFWNARGLGISKKRLRSLLKIHKPKMLMVAEHFRSVTKLLRCQNIFRFDASFSNGINDGKLWIF